MTIGVLFSATRRADNDGKAFAAIECIDSFSLSYCQLCGWGPDGPGIFGFNTFWRVILSTDQLYV